MLVVRLLASPREDEVHDGFLQALLWGAQVQEVPKGEGGPLLL